MDALSESAKTARKEWELAEQVIAIIEQTGRPTE
jgi:hypothetical protein